jgi:hypothetical protein
MRIVPFHYGLDKVSVLVALKIQGITEHSIKI